MSAPSPESRSERRPNPATPLPPVAAALPSDPPPLRSGAPRRWWLLVALLLVLGWPLGHWWHYQSGYITSRYAVVRGELADLGTRVDGVLARRLVQPGERVAAAQELGTLEDDHLRADVAEAEAHLETQRQELTAEQSAIEHERRSLENRTAGAAAQQAAAAADVSAARSRLAQAQAHHRARRTLLQDKAIAREEVENTARDLHRAQAHLLASEARFEEARAHRRNAELETDGLTLRRQRLPIRQARVAEAQARLGRAKADLAGMRIRAPSEGLVQRWHIHPGGSVEAGQPVVSLLLGHTRWVEAWIDEDQVGTLAPGAQALVTFASLPGREVRGAVERIGDVTDFELPDTALPQPRLARMRGTPVVAVEVRLQDPPPQLLPGMTAVVAIRVAPASP